MSRSKSLVSIGVLIVTLMVVLSFSFASVASAQEARWKDLNNQVMELL